MVNPSLSEATDPLLQLSNVAVSFVNRRRTVNAVDGVTISVSAGEAVALVGESGCGKSTLARAACGLQRVDAGIVRIRGRDPAARNKAERRAAQEHAQMVFQDPRASLNPRMRVSDIVAEPLRLRKIASAKAALQSAAMLERCGLGSAALDLRPEEFSGGQRQRIAIARALVTEPELLICDEPVSALDVSIQAQILNLLIGLQRERHLAMLFITHDLGVVRQVADVVAVMYAGRIVELQMAETLFNPPKPAHPYTAALFAAAPGSPLSGAASTLVQGELTTGAGTGCPYRSRCWLHERLQRPDICQTTDPGRAERLGDVACHFRDDVSQQLRPVVLAASAEGRE